MRLPDEKLNVSEQMDEFDQWLTARLERIKDNEKFSSEINSLCDCINSIAPNLGYFADPEVCNVDRLSDALLSASASIVTGESFVDDEDRVAVFINAFFNLLFLTSGATDNNLKNHFLIKLKEDDVESFFPRRKMSKGKIVFYLQDVPATTKSDFVSKMLASLIVSQSVFYRENVVTEPYFDVQFYIEVFLKCYVELIFESDEEFMQFWAVCSSYIRLSSIKSDSNLGVYLLNACTIFKIRGSVSASGGHIPERILREKLILMGLRPDLEFNVSDVIIGEEEVIEGSKRKKKTRAYDFIIPFNIDKWDPNPRLFIQSQFYAGDSGSVSHKVVDQTQSTREFTLKKYGNARFVEYLDGAGYYASLRGDLSHMLSFDSTASFFQVRSIFVRLRRELQFIRLLTPIEIGHAIFTGSSSSFDCVVNKLRGEGYPNGEIERVIHYCIEVGIIARNGEEVWVSESYIDISRRLLVLDIAALNAVQLTKSQISSQKYFLIPGYGANRGLLQSALADLVCSVCKQIEISATVFTEDIEWLLDEGVIRRC